MHHRMIRHMVRPILCLSIAAPLGGQAASARTSSAAPEFIFRADSALYHVRYGDPTYSTTIGSVFVNRSHTAISSNYCRTPPAPILEKDIGGGHWVRAYGEIALTCKMSPPFRVAAGRTYRGSLHVEAARPEAHIVCWIRLQLDVGG